MRTLYVALILGCLSMTAHAQSVTIDLSRLSSDRAAQVLQAQKDIEKLNPPAVPVPTVDQAKQWANVGEQVADAISATAKALSISVNDFMQTPVGWWAFVFIFWYFLGAKLWAIIAGCIAWLVLGTIVWKSYRMFHMPNKVLVKQEGNVKTYEYRKFEWRSEDAKTTSACMHVGTFVALSIVMLLIIL